MTDLLVGAEDYTQSKSNKNLSHIPGENGLPFLGKTINLLSDSMAMCQHHYDHYGAVSRIHMTGMAGILALGPEANKTVFNDPKGNFSSQMGYDQRLGNIFADGLALKDFGEHKIQRRMMQTAFKTPAMKSYVAQVNAIYNSQLSEWATKKDFHFFPNIKNVLLEVGSKIFLGMNSTPQETQKINDAFLDCIEGLLYIAPVDLPGFRFHKGMRGRRYMEKVIKEIIPSHREGNGKDMLSHMCREKTEIGQFFSDHEIMSNMIFLLFAAHDTTSSTLSHCLYYLSKNPEWEQKVRDEIAALNKDELSYEDLDNMTTMGNVFNETLRLRPAAPMLVRRTVREIEMEGQTVPANTMVFVYPGFAHRMPEFWSNPESFDPDRFSDTRAEHKSHPFAFCPFGGGAHKCIGMHLAQLEFKCFLFQFLKRYRFKTPENYNPALPVFPLPKPADDLPLTLSSIH